MAHHPEPVGSIQISLAVYHQLLEAVGASLWKKELWEIAAEAIDEYARRHLPDTYGKAQTAGYQWKRLFLPSGTVLRTVYKGKNYHCIVEADQILYNGKAISPNAFVNAVGGIRRNAWNSLWVLLPETTHWQLADMLRVRPRPARARRSPDTARPRPAPVPVKPADDAPGQNAPHCPATAMPATVIGADGAIRPSRIVWLRQLGRRPRKPLPRGAADVAALVRREVASAMAQLATNGPPPTGANTSLRDPVTEAAADMKNAARRRLSGIRFG